MLHPTPHSASVADSSLPPEQKALLLVPIVWWEKLPMSILVFLKMCIFLLHWVFTVGCRLSLVAVHGLLTVVASLVVGHRLQAHGLQQLQHMGPVAVAPGL